MTPRFLIDAQLSRAFGRHFQNAGFECAHVNSVRLGNASDRDIWLYAGHRRFVLVTKDRDFVQMAQVDPVGPQIIWIRMGNSTSNTLWTAIEPDLPKILERLRSGERVVPVG